MAGFQAFELAELQAAHVQRGRAYSEFLRRPDMSMGLYVLAAGGDDHQHPHTADEVYVILSGVAKIRVDDELHDVREGSVVSVDRGRDHGFVDITEDLHVLVVFAPAESPDV